MNENKDYFEYDIVNKCIHEYEKFGRKEIETALIIYPIDNGCIYFPHLSLELKKTLNKIIAKLLYFACPEDLISINVSSPTNPNVTYIPPRMLKDFNAGLLLDKCNDVIEVGMLFYLDINHTAKKRHLVSISQPVNIYKSKKVEEYGNSSNKASDIKCVWDSSNPLPIGFKRNLRQ
jgi:hypothetical protein